MPPKKLPHPFQLITGSDAVEPDSREEPLQSADSLVLRGVRSNTMSKKEIHDATRSIIEFGQAGPNDRSDTFVKARSILLTAEIIADLDLLDSSPTVLDTAKGAMARIISSVHLNVLREAFEIEEMTASPDTTEQIFRYRSKANSALNNYKRTNIVRILDELEQSGEVARDEMSVLRRTVGHVFAAQLERRKGTNRPSLSTPSD